MKKVIDKLSVFLATIFGVGYTPLCPGTAASVVGVGVFFLIKSQSVFLIVTLVSVIISFMVSGRAEKVFGVKDCKKIVIDDYSGMLITLLFVPRDIPIIFVVAAFFLFRMLDMLKVFPSNRVEKLNGSMGVVGDDVIAGIYASGVLQTVRLLFKIFS